MDEPMKNEIQLFEDQKIRVAWDAAQEEWYFSIVDVVGILTDSPDYNTGRKYWNKLKQRLKDEGSELVTNCHQLKMRAADGKNRLTDVWLGTRKKKTAAAMIATATVKIPISFTAST